MKIDNNHRRLTNSGCAVQRDALAPGIQQQQIRYVDHTRGSRYVKSCHETTVLPDGSILEVPLAYLTPWLGAAFGQHGLRGLERLSPNSVVDPSTYLVPRDADDDKISKPSIRLGVASRMTSEGTVSKS